MVKFNEEGAFEILYTPRTTLILTTDTTTNYIKFTLTVPTLTVPANAGEIYVCLFGKDKIPASECSLNGALNEFTIKPPL